MSAVMITGISGAGKSTVAGALAHRGLASIDADNDPSLARFMDRTGAVVAFPAAPDFAGFPGTAGSGNPARLDGRRGAARSCGRAGPGSGASPAPASPGDGGDTAALGNHNLTCTSSVEVRVRAQLIACRRENTTSAKAITEA